MIIVGFGYIQLEMYVVCEGTVFFNILKWILFIQRRYELFDVEDLFFRYMKIVVMWEIGYESDEYRYVYYLSIKSFLDFKINKNRLKLKYII